MSETKLFGTDGIRAPFGEPPLDRATVTALAVALGRRLREEGSPGAAGEGSAVASPEVVLGGDTRASTEEICGWIASGLAASGVASRYLGTVPTPAVAFLVAELGAAAGVAVSASHNPLPDNGVKLLDRRGAKWQPAAEAALEERMGEDGIRAVDVPLRSPTLEDGLVERYLEHLAATLAEVEGDLPGKRPLAGLRLALDAAHGAASPFAAPLFERLGAEVVALCDAPDGTNINRGCGSTHPEGLARRVREEGLDLGFAFDGDADRAILVDAEGEVRDGDAILYLWATSLHAAGRLDPPAIVATSMSNLGLEKALEARGIRLVRCGVGDREVVATLRREGLVLGGEQSGHIIHLGLSSTGDGILTALQVAARVAARKRAAGDASQHPLAALLEGFRRYPQVLQNVRVARKPPLDSLPGVQAAVERVEEELAEQGRLVLRYSGTEPLARVMIEGPDQETIERLAGELASALEKEIGA